MRVNRLQRVSRGARGFGPLAFALAFGGMDLQGDDEKMSLCQAVACLLGSHVEVRLPEKP